MLGKIAQPEFPVSTISSWDKVNSRKRLCADSGGLNVGTWVKDSGVALRTHHSSQKGSVREPQEKGGSI